MHIHHMIYSAVIDCVCVILYPKVSFIVSHTHTSNASPPPQRMYYAYHVLFPLINLPFLLPEATGLGFVCFVVIDPRVLSAN